MFRSSIRGVPALLAYAAAHGLIYLLVKSEDYALPNGLVSAFGAVVLTKAVMRNLDWFGVRTIEKR